MMRSNVQITFCIFFTFVLLHYSVLLFSQRESEISKIRKYDRQDIENLLENAEKLIESEPNESFEYVEKALIKSIKEKNKSGEGKSNQTLGKINFRLHQYDLAVNYYKKAIHIFSSLRNEAELYETYWLIAQAYEKQKEFDTSAMYYKKYLEYSEKQEIKDNTLQAKNKLADIYYQSGDNNKAMEIYNDVLTEEKSRNNQRGIIEAQNKIGEIYVESNKPDQALDVYKQSEQLAEHINDKEILANTLNQQSKALRKEKRFDEELNVRKRSLQINNELDNITSQAEDNYEIGNIYIEKKEADKAIPYIQRSIDLAEKTGNLEKKGKALQTLSTAFKEKGEYDKALDIYKEYTATVDHFYRQREEELKKTIGLIAEFNKNLPRLDLLERELQLSEKTVVLLQQEQRAQRILIYSLISALFISAVASFIVYRSASQKRKANMLLALQSLRSQMNPHFIFNSLNSVNSFISKNDEKSANKYLTEFSQLMRAVMENSKYDFVSLQSEIEILQLYLELEHFRFENKFDYKFDIDSKLDYESYEIPPMLIQPYVENAIWHGLRYKEEKGYLHLSIHKNNGHLLVVVEDNGIGRKKSEEIKTKNQKETVSTGLRNIENRLKIINELHKIRLDVQIEDLDKNNNTGTKVSIKIPHKLVML